MQLAYELCLAGVGGCADPDELFERLSSRQWVGWQLFAKHFSTPLRRADLNSALERQAALVPYCKRGRVPTVDDLLVKYGRPVKAKKSAAEVFNVADAAFSAAAAMQKTKSQRKRK